LLVVGEDLADISVVVGLGVERENGGCLQPAAVRFGEDR
jgi:hypothetical protein